MPENLQSRKRLIRNATLFLVPAIITATTLYILWQSHPDLEYWKGLAIEGRNFLEAHPFALLLALATLPGIGFPISPLFILTGIVIGGRYGLPTACVAGIIAQSICTTWTYLLAVGPLRGFLTSLISKKQKLPELTETNALRLALILRITPGIPYALQNIVLGVIGMQIRTYLLVSIPITALWTIAFIITGGAIFEGQAGLAVSGFLLLVVLVLVTRMLRNKTKENYAG